MNNYWKFILVGMIFSQILEFFTHEVVRADDGGYGFFMIALYFVILNIFYFAGRLFKRERKYMIFFGIFMVVVLEWVLIGESVRPKLITDIGLIVLQVFFQFGMFAYWACVAYLPRLWLQKGASKLKRKMRMWYVPWTIAAYLIGGLVPWPEEAVFIPIFMYQLLFIIFFFWSYKYARSKA